MSEVFSAIQGEAALVGERQVFVRLTGCNIRCTYCDQPEALERLPVRAGSSRRRAGATGRSSRARSAIDRVVERGGGHCGARCPTTRSASPAVSRFCRATGWRSLVERLPGWAGR